MKRHSFGRIGRFFAGIGTLLALACIMLVFAILGTGANLWSLATTGKRAELD